MVERSMRHPEEIRTAVGRRLANLSVTQAQYAGEDENSLLHGKRNFDITTLFFVNMCELFGPAVFQKKGKSVFLYAKNKVRELN